MSGLNAIAPPTNHCRAGAFTKSGFYRWLPLLVSSCVWSLGPSVAECAPQSRTTASPRLTPPSAAEMLKRASRFGGSITRNTEGGEFDRRESSPLNPLGIRYAKGQGVKRDPAMAKRFFLRSAIKAIRQPWPISERSTRSVQKDMPISSAHMHGHARRCRSACREYCHRPC